MLVLINEIHDANVFQCLLKYIPHNNDWGITGPKSGRLVHNPGVIAVRLPEGFETSPPAGGVTAPVTH